MILITNKKESGMNRLKRLFLCTGNSCRSQMAEGWCAISQTEVDRAHRQASNTHGMNPNAVQVMAEAGVDITHQLIEACG